MAATLTSFNLSTGSTSSPSITYQTSNGYHTNNSTSGTYSGHSLSSSAITSLSASTPSPASLSPSSPNLYRVGDYVYIETSPTSPYQVCKIEELVKNQNGNSEAKLVVFYRRRDISFSLIQQIEKQSALEDDQEKELEQLSEKEKHQVKLRELYLSRQIETYPVTCIRGKCTVSLLSEAESLANYLQKEDAFYYTQVYDPEQKSLSEADRGEIRVGQRFQAEVPSKPLENAAEKDDRDLSQLETLVYKAEHSLTDEQIDQFLVVAKSVGIYARSVDCSSSVKQPNLLMSAQSAARDITVQNAMDVLHRCDYDLAKAVCSLVPGSMPTLCRDELEEWSPLEAAIFDDAYDKCEKRFDEIRHNFLPWKSMKNLIEYYYFWKATDRYVQRKRVKAVEAESKLKHVYVSPSLNKQNTTNGVGDVNGSRQCESCKKTSSSNWNAWGPSHLQYFLCQTCWNFWRKFGAFKYANRLADMTAEKLQVNSNSLSSSQTNNLVRQPPINDLNTQYPCRECNKVFNRHERLMSHLASHRPHKCSVNACGKEFKFKAHLARHCANSHGVAMRSCSPRPIMKTRAAFHYSVVSSLRLARRLCGDILSLKRGARKPFILLNIAAFKQEYAERYQKGVQPLPPLRKINRGSVTEVSHRLGTPRMPKPEWLIALPKDKLPQPQKIIFPSNNHDESKTKDLGDIRDTAESGRKRPLEQNGNLLSSKRRQMAPPSILGKSVPDLYENISRNSVLTQSLNGRAKTATIDVRGQKQKISWVDAPDDVFFVSNAKIKQMRRKIPTAELLRAARQPYKQHNEYLARFSSSANSANSGSQSASNSSIPRASSLASSAVSSMASKLGVTSSSAAAAAALNLAGITAPLTGATTASQQQQVAALLQHPMFAQNILGASHNHLVSSNVNFFNSLSANANGSNGKLNR